MRKAERPSGACASLEDVKVAFSRQIEWCENLGSPFTARILEIVSANLMKGGVVTELVSSWPADPIADALPLRFAGALHALVLVGATPELQAYYPPSTVENSEQLRVAVLSALRNNRIFVEEFIKAPPQTNEVGRSAVLVGGFHFIARRTRMPLRLLEIGASAGLNLNWDRYRYALGQDVWGSEASPVVLAPDWRGPRLALAPNLRIVERRSCDREPIDLRDAAARLRLRAYVWADQIERLRRLDAAINLARAGGAQVERADAAEWVVARLAELHKNCTKVLYHSIMWQYLSPTAQAEIIRAVQAAGTRATATSPLAWLRFEPEKLDAKPELRLTLWPEARHFLLAVAHPHGKAVEWIQKEISEGSQ
jgi:hypothetical protein